MIGLGSRLGIAKALRMATNVVEERWNLERPMAKFKPIGTETRFMWGDEWSPQKKSPTLECFHSLKPTFFSSFCNTYQSSALRFAHFGKRLKPWRLFNLVILLIAKFQFHHSHVYLKNFSHHLQLPTSIPNVQYIELGYSNSLIL